MNQEIFEQILLEEEQKELLTALVEAWRNKPREKRRKFIFVQTTGGSFIMGLDNCPNPYKGDVEILAQARLLNAGYGRRGDLIFDITPLGFEYYEYLKNKSDTPAQAVEQSILSFLDSEGFKARYPEAYSKWTQAAKRLWSSDSQKELTTIGHYCREAMQHFATSLIQEHSPEDVTPDVMKTVKRVEAVLKQHNDATGQTAEAVLVALLAYWAELNNLVQRQEHGAQREGEPLKWEDARRVVFHTAIVMFEIDKAVGK